MRAEDAAKALSAGASAFKIDPQNLKGTVCHSWPPLT